jgi:hypothetical protein
VRVAFTRHEIGVGHRRCASAGEARHRQIEAAPEEVHRARLAEKAATELVEDVRDRDHRAPASIGIVGIVGGMDGVLLEGDGIGDFDRHGPDVHIDAQCGESGPELGVKGSNRLGRQP